MVANGTDLIFGSARPQANYPRQQSELILLNADRYNRASSALNEWSETAKKSVEYFENKQWSKEDLAKLQKEGRPALTINKIKPLVNLVLGYHLTNLTDIHYKPGHDGTGAAATADALTHVAKAISERCQLPYVDAEVFLDGVLTGRGYWDSRLDFTEHDLGEIKHVAQDPFSTYLDPDGQSYDINHSNYVMTSRWISLEEIEFYYGKEAMTAVGPWIGNGQFSGVPVGLYEGQEELTPWRRFGGEQFVEENSYWNSYFNGFWDWVDRQRQSIRMIDVQHYVRVERWYFVDLETGERSPVPDHWNRDKVRKVLDYYRNVKGEPLDVQRRKTRRLRHTQQIGDVIVYDEWSPYRQFTLTPYFPYFRRGQTKGMVEDLLDPQDEVNKRRSARINIIGRASNGGWIYEKNSLDAKERLNLEENGSAPGFQLSYDSKGGTLPAPQQIVPGTPPVAMAQLEQEGEDDIKQIAGINESAMGQLESANASGRAVEARQKQTIVGLEGFMSNYRRSKELLGKKQLQLIQDHYTEERIVRLTGGNTLQSNRPMQMTINQRSESGEIINNVTLGNYAVSIDTSPLSSTYLEAQFEEIMRLKELGMPIPDEFVVDASSLGRKDEMKEAIQQARAMQQQQQMAGMLPPDQQGPPRSGAGDAAGPAGTEAGPPPQAAPGPQQAQAQGGAVGGAMS
jgi:hypothetical protein